MDRAVQVLEAAVGMNAQDLEARSRLGTTYAQMGRVADAERGSALCSTWIRSLPKR